MTQNYQEEESVTIFGDEWINEEAKAHIDKVLSRHRPPHEIKALSGFDFANKVIAITDQSMVVAHQNGESSYFGYDHLKNYKREGRTLVLTK